MERLTNTAVWEILIHCYGAREEMPDGSFKDTLALRTVNNYLREVMKERA